MKINKFKTCLLNTFAFLLLTQVVTAQTGFTPKVEKYIDDYIASLTPKKTELETINNWYADFKKGEKPNVKNYSNNLIGLGIGVTREKEHYNYLPAKYYFNNNKVVMEKISSKKHEQSDINSYTKAYFKGLKSLKKAPLYANLNKNKLAIGAKAFKENDNELYVKGSFEILFIRAYKKHLYVISLNKNYTVWKNKEIVFFKFDLSSTNNPNSESIITSKLIAPKEKRIVTSSNYQLSTNWQNAPYTSTSDHYRSVKSACSMRSQIGDSSRDEEFVAKAKKVLKNLNPNNVNEYIEELEFFENYKWEVNDERHKVLSYNMNRSASYVLADYFMRKKEYAKAITYFNNSLKYKHPSTYGLEDTTCLNNIYSNLVEAYFALNKEEEAVLCLLAMIPFHLKGKPADKELTTYVNTINSKKFKEDFIWAIESMKPVGESKYAITYKNHTAIFDIPDYLVSLRNIKVILVKSNTYNNFDYK